MNRKLLWAVLAIGLVLVIAPFALGLPGKAAAGERMMNGFQPIMQPTQVNTTARYYNQVFVPLGQVAPAINATTIATFQGYADGMKAAEPEVPALIGALAQQLHMTPAQVQQFLAGSFPATTQLLTGLPTIQTDLAALVGVMSQHTSSFAQVPAGLAFYKPLVDTMQANVSNFAAIDSLPPFGLFMWFFLIPGVLVIVLGLAALFAGRRRTPTGVDTR